MKSSLLPLPSTRDLNLGEDGPPPKKRGRGRPLKAVGQSTIPEERRQQVRKAQNAFRQRKQAAMKSLEQRAEVLEECIEEISKVFLSFSDSMLKTQLVQKDPAIGRNLLTTTSRIVELAKIAGANNHADSRYTSSSEEENSSLKSQKGLTLHPSPSSPSVIDNSQCRAKDVSHVYNIFGNGWFGYEPAAMTDARRRNQDLNVPLGGFGLKLIKNNLQVAYFAILDDTGLYGTLVTQMYRYAFLYHSREEILANLRWFLEHGMQAQQHLGRAVFGFDTTLSLQHLNIGHVHQEPRPRILHPLVDAQALLDAEYTSSAMPFLNAFDVEEYLVAKGAFHIDDETIYMQTSKTKGTESSCEEEPSMLASQVVQNEPTMSANLGNADICHRTASRPSRFASIPTSTSSNKTSTSNGKPCGIFDFNALLKDANDQSIMEEVVQGKKGESSSKQAQIISLSVPLLLDNLIRNSLCLGTGPGYPRNSIDVAIESSTRPSTMNL